MKLSLIDSDHRRTGNTEPVATAYKVYRGDERVRNALYALYHGLGRGGEPQIEISGEDPPSSTADSTWRPSWHPAWTPR